LAAAKPKATTPRTARPTVNKPRTPSRKRRSRRHRRRERRDWEQWIPRRAFL